VLAQHRQRHQVARTKAQRGEDRLGTRPHPPREVVDQRGTPMGGLGDPRARLPRGGYGPGAPREGWDHAEPWLPHALRQVGLEPRFITAELTLADTVPQMAELKPLAAESLRNAERAIDALWSPVAA
jgi:hypothetical protein